MPVTSTHYGRFAAALTLLLALCACGDLFTHHEPAHAPAAKAQRYDALAYVKSLTEANRLLEGGVSLADIAGDTKVIEAYSKQKKNKAGEVVLVVLEYSDKDGKTRKSIAPMDHDFAALSDTLGYLDGMSASLKEVHILKVTVSPPVNIKITGQDTAAVSSMLRAREQAIMESGRKVPALEEARLQLKLLHYFIQAQRRDAAYLCADNTKRLLSSAHEGGDKAAVDALAQELDAAEGELHEKMPY